MDLFDFLLWSLGPVYLSCHYAFFVAVRDEADIFDDSKTFHPDMCHQIFGDRWVHRIVGINENISLNTQCMYYWFIDDFWNGVIIQRNIKYCYIKSWKQNEYLHIQYNGESPWPSGYGVGLTTLQSRVQRRHPAWFDCEALQDIGDSIHPNLPRCKWVPTLLGGTCNGLVSRPGGGSVQLHSKWLAPWKRGLNTGHIRGHPEL